MAFYDPISSNTPDAPKVTGAIAGINAASSAAPSAAPAYNPMSGNSFVNAVGSTQSTPVVAAPTSAASSSPGSNRNTPPNTAPDKGYQWQWLSLPGSPGSGEWRQYPISGGGGGGATGGGQTQATTSTVKPGGGSNQSALQIITDALNGAGLSSLAANAWTMWNKGYDINAIMDDPTNGIRASDAYKTVFPAMAKLNAMGEGITEGEYLAKMKADKEILKQFNVPSGIFDTPDYLGSLMLNHVNTVDLTNRLQAAQDSVLSLDPNITKYAKDTYGLDAGHLMAWALDPTKATPIIAQQAKAMQIGGAAVQAGFGGMGVNGQLTTDQAEALANQGITQAQAQQHFVQLGQMGQYGQMLPGDVSGALTNQQMINAEFNANANDVMALNKVKATRVNEFNAGGALAANAGGIGGIGAANLQA